MPTDSASFNKGELEEIVAIAMLNRYNRSRTRGTKAILQKMESMGVRPLPSVRSGARILARLGFTNGRTGHDP